VLWKYQLKMRTFVELERIIWRSSKVFIFTNPYTTVLATKLEAAACSQQAISSSEEFASSEVLGRVAGIER
jgi:hypothetical protein